MIFDTPFTLEAREPEHALLPATAEQVAQYLFGQISLNTHLCRDAFPGVHCPRHASLVAWTWLQERLPHYYAHRTDACAQAELADVRRLVSARLQLPEPAGGPPTVVSDAYSFMGPWAALVAVAIVALPKDQEEAVMAALFQGLLQVTPSFQRQCIEDLLDRTSRSLMEKWAEIGRRKINELHIDDPTPDKEMQFEVDAEAASRAIFEEAGFDLSAIPTKPTCH